MVRVSEAMTRLPNVSHALLNASLKVHVIEAAEAGARSLPLLAVSVTTSLAEQSTLAGPCPVLVGEQSGLLG